MTFTSSCSVIKGKKNVQKKGSRSSFLYNGIDDSLKKQNQDPWVEVMPLLDQLVRSEKL